MFAANDILSILGINDCKQENNVYNKQNQKVGYVKKSKHRIA